MQTERRTAGLAASDRLAFEARALAAAAWAVVALAAMALASPGARAQSASTTAATQVFASGIARVVAAGTPVVQIADGFDGSEGPIGLPDGRLLFTETRADRIIAVDAADHLETFLEASNGSNALALDRRGRLYAAQTKRGSMRVGIVHPASAVRTLVDGFDGEPLNRPNDLVLDRHGGLYFTDPGQGIGPEVGKGRLPVSVYYIPPDGTARRVATGIVFPNGILLSRDERTLYVNDSRGRHMSAFDVRRGGELANRREFATYQGVEAEADGSVHSSADGLAIDSDGRLYAATPPGVQVFDARGRHLGTIPTPRPAQNLAFAGPGKRTLYVVARGALLKIQMLSRGFAGRAK